MDRLHSMDDSIQYKYDENEKFDEEIDDTVSYISLGDIINVEDGLIKTYHTVIDFFSSEGSEISTLSTFSDFYNWICDYVDIPPYENLDYESEDDSDYSNEEN